MDSNQFRQLVRRHASSLSFAWLQMNPELLQTFHQLAIDSKPQLHGIRAPLDGPVHDLVMGTQIRPSEMQVHLLNTVVPVTLVAIQSIAEDVLESSVGPASSVLRRIESLVEGGQIDRSLGSKAHHWRMARNVIAHGQGTIDQQTEAEAARLLSEGRITFGHFKLWGPLLDTGHGGPPAPIADRAVAAPDSPDPGLPEVQILTGNRIEIGIGDLLAAGNVWAGLIEAAVR